MGLPDNAVKESRERIKSALRNRGFEFPYGQGVTINLAPADVSAGRCGAQSPIGAISWGQKTYSNAQMLPKMLRKHCGITADGEKLLENAITRLGLSARAHDRILKVARTIADLEATESIAPKHLSEAIQYRTLDRSYWA